MRNGYLDVSCFLFGVSYFFFFGKLRLNNANYLLFHQFNRIGHNNLCC